MSFWITPTRFKKISDILLPISLVCFLILLPISLWSALINSPSDYQQGEAVRMMYVHVPAAMLSMNVFFVIALSGASFLIWKNPLSAIIMKSMIPIGACFCFLCLVTGMLWGKPIWGVYWVWDGRLTSVLILFFLYIGLHIFYNSFDDAEKGAKMTAILAIIGAVNLPIIRFSVKWWNTLHQPASLMRLDKPAMPMEMLTPLILMFFTFFFAMLIAFILKTKKEILLKKLNRSKI